MIWFALFFAIVNSWQYLFLHPHAGTGRDKTPSKSNRDVSTRNLYEQICTDPVRPKPSLSRLHHKQQRERTNTPSLHRRQPRCQSCAPTTNCPSCKRRRDTTTVTPLWPPAVSARRSLGSFRLSFIGKAPRHYTRERTRSSCAQWTVSGRLHIITTTRRKSDLANTWSTRGMRKPV